MNPVPRDHLVRYGWVLLCLLPWLIVLAKPSLSGMLASDLQWRGDELIGDIAFVSPTKRLDAWYLTVGLPRNNSPRGPEGIVSPWLVQHYRAVRWAHSDQAVAVLFVPYFVVFLVIVLYQYPGSIKLKSNDLIVGSLISVVPIGLNTVASVLAHRCLTGKIPDVVLVDFGAYWHSSHYRADLQVITMLTLSPVLWAGIYITVTTWIRAHHLQRVPDERTRTHNRIVRFSEPGPVPLWFRVMPWGLLLTAVAFSILAGLAGSLDRSTLIETRWGNVLNSVLDWTGFAPENMSRRYEMTEPATYVVLCLIAFLGWQVVNWRWFMPVSERPVATYALQWYRWTLIISTGLLGVLYVLVTPVVLKSRQAVELRVHNALHRSYPSKTKT